MKIISACFLVVFASAISFSQEVDLRSDKQTYLVGEPVYLRVNSNREYPVIPEFGVAALIITNPDGSTWSYKPPMQYCKYDLNKKNFPKVDYITLIVSEGHLVFDKPGNYSVHLALEPDVKDRISNQVELVIGNPTAFADVNALKIIRRNIKEYGSLVYLEAGEQFADGLAIIKDVSAFENSYRKHARFVLSSLYSESYLDYKNGRSRPIELGKAIEYSQSEDSRSTSFQRMKNADKMIKAIGSLKKEGRTVDAQTVQVVRRHLNAVMKTLPDEDSQIFQDFNDFKAEQ